MWEIFQMSCGIFETTQGTQLEADDFPSRGAEGNPERNVEGRELGIWEGTAAAWTGDPKVLMSSSADAFGCEFAAPLVRSWLPFLLGPPAQANVSQVRHRSGSTSSPARSRSLDRAAPILGVQQMEHKLSKVAETPFSCPMDGIPP